MTEELIRPCTVISVMIRVNIHTRVEFKHFWCCVIFPSSLWGIESLAFPSCLESLTFGSHFQQSLALVHLPRSLQCLTLGADFDQNLTNVHLPTGLKSLTLGYHFNQSLERVTLPRRLQSLTFGHDFNQSLEQVNLPSSLQHLFFGHDFNQPLDRVTLPSSIESIAFGANFRQSLKHVDLQGLRRLTFADHFNESLEHVKLPQTLHMLHYRGLGVRILWQSKEIFKLIHISLQPCLFHGRCHPVPWMSFWIDVSAVLSNFLTFAIYSTHHQNETNTPLWQKCVGWVGASRNYSDMTGTCGYMWYNSRPGQQFPSKTSTSHFCTTASTYPRSHPPDANPCYCRDTSLSCSAYCLYKPEDNKHPGPPKKKY